MFFCRSAPRRSGLPFLLALAWIGCSSTGSAGPHSSGGQTAGGTPASGGRASAGSGGAGGTGSGAGGAASGADSGQGLGQGGAAASGGSNGSSASGETASGGTSAPRGTGGAAGGGGTGDTATGGSIALGGTAGGGTEGSATGGTSGSDSFSLAWQDDFDTLDTSLWQAQTFTWDGNQAQFTPQNVSVASGKLTIALTNAPSGSTKPYLGVELRSTKTLTYGKVSASMRFAKGSGVVSGLVLFYTPYPNCDWNEIDIEHLGNSSNTSQLNCMVYTGTPATSCTTSVTPTQEPQVVNLGSDAESAFHQYDIEWTPAGVKFFIDGTLLRTWTANISRLKLPLNILLTIWASSSASWAGSLNAASAPTSAEVDWIKVYGWNG
jgi:endo-1,3-1,4-beta-glycanase ExoK